MSSRINIADVVTEFVSLLSDTAKREIYFKLLAIPNLSKSELATELLFQLSVENRSLTLPEHSVFFTKTGTILHLRQ